MALSTLNTSSLITSDQAHIWHPFTQMKTAKPPIPIVKARGAYLFSADGKSYLDAISSWWVNLHGHSHPYIAERIKAQVDELEHVLFAGFTHPPAVTLAERLLPLLPGQMSKLFYSDNGSTAVEVAIKIALQFWHNTCPAQPKTRVIGFRKGYHGDTFGAMSAAGQNDFNRPFWKHLFAVDVIDAPMPGEEEQSLSQLKAVLDKGNVACFIFEPLILGSNGMHVYSAPGLDALIALCRQYKVVTIADEAMTGFGRTGTLFACDQLKESPDMICLAKGLTGGFLPMAATACSQRLFDAFWSDSLAHAFLHGHSYTANPIACSSALASLDLLLEESSSNDRERIARQHSAFCRRWQGHPKLTRCESLGTILIVEFRSDQDPSYFAPYRDTLYDFFMSRGILVRPLGNVIYLMPPYCISEEDLEGIYDVIATLLDGMLSA